MREIFSDEVFTLKVRQLDASVEEGNPKQVYKANRTPPDLTFLGEKLRETKLANLLAGKMVEKPRPWMTARLPSFSHRSNSLAKGFSRSCGVEIKGLKQFVDMDVNEMEKARGALVSTLCITSHGVGESKPTAVFEGQGVNLLFFASPYL